MLEALEVYYREHGILATSFECKHRTECGSGCAEFTGPKSAFVSSGYERADLPRLLFISLDSGSGNSVDTNRLPSAVRQCEEVERSFEGLAKHKHWYRTHELAWYILRRFDPSLQIQQARRLFAHANSAKCCMNKPQRKKANAVLFRNCEGYLSGELAILRPNIVVTQGNEARDAFSSVVARVAARLDEYASVVETPYGLLFWLHTYHPNNWGAFNKQRAFDQRAKVATGWVKYSAMIQEFVAGLDRGKADA